MTYKSGEEIKCEECGEKCEGRVDDYVIPGRNGAASMASDKCGYCDWAFTVVKDADGTFDVEAE